MEDAQKSYHASSIAVFNRLREDRRPVSDFPRELKWEPWVLANQCA